MCDRPIDVGQRALDVIDACVDDIVVFANPVIGVEFLT